MKFNDQRQVSGHRRTEAEQKAIRAKFIDALRREHYAGGTIPKQELEKARQRGSSYVPRPLDEEQILEAARPPE